MTGSHLSRLRVHSESHTVDRIGWLRAAVLGANDGIVSTASLLVGVAAADGSHSAVLVAGLAGLVAGAMSMAAGEYVSVSSQSDTEAADLARERAELRDQPQEEIEELTQIYVERGVEPALARQVAIQMMEKDALGAHARDELGITEVSTARPLQAAFASALTFAAGAALPLTAAVFAPAGFSGLTITVVSVFSLATLGLLGARAGGAGTIRPALRVTFWGVAAMAMTAVIGYVFGVALL
jgi:VIT1/CCC1 family predicted Fe2+/Mn2+ transporter